jgi:hypothetical protein
MRIRDIFELIYKYNYDSRESYYVVIRDILTNKYCSSKDVYDLYTNIEQVYNGMLLHHSEAKVRRYMDRLAEILTYAEVERVFDVSDYADVCDRIHTCIYGDRNADDETTYSDAMTDSDSDSDSSDTEKDDHRRPSFIIPAVLFSILAACVFCALVNVYSYVVTYDYLSIDSRMVVSDASDSLHTILSYLDELRVNTTRNIFDAITEFCFTENVKENL